ncbi:TMEM175 family protein [Microbispora sp. NPDC046933]|uniref:TMEM175 family protein n=1 Tax=Microbispora sp. NPDC046933 TaxID=3155618 RepID=UPI00340B9BD4
MATPQVRPGLTHERVGVFADAIFAIAITLLALELPRPEAEDFARLGSFLGDHLSSFIAFAMAFLMLWFAWRAHHTLFDQIERLSQSAVALHIPLLFFVAFLPYTTAMFGEANHLPAGASGGRALVIAMFAANEAVLLLCQGALTSLVMGQRLYRPDTDLARLRVNAWVYWAIGGYWLLTAVAAAWTSDAVPFMWLATPVVASGVVRLIRRR